MSHHEQCLCASCCADHLRVWLDDAERALAAVHDDLTLVAAAENDLEQMRAGIRHIQDAIRTHLQAINGPENN